MKVVKGLLSAMLIAAVAALFVSCPNTLESSASSGTASVYQLSAATNLQAVPRNGFVYLTWNPVVEAQQYAVYRSTPVQTGVDANTDTAFSLIGVVDARDTAYLYDGRAAVVGGANTYLDYVNLDNPLMAGTYHYAIVVMRDDDDDLTETIPFINSVLSASVQVTLAAVPAKGSILPAPTNFEVNTFGPATRLSWDLDPLFDCYYIFGFDQSDADDIYAALAQTDDTARSVSLINLTTMPIMFGDSPEIRTHAVNLTGDYSDSWFGILGVPRDAYYGHFSYVAFQDIPADTLAVPENLTATSTHETEIILEFDAVADADNYQVWRSNTGYDDWVQLTTTSADFEVITSLEGRVRYHDTYQLEAGVGTARTYYYKVRAVNGTGDVDELSWFSNLAKGNITTESGVASFGTITDLAATDGEFSNKIELTWTKVDGAESYLIYRTEGGALAASADSYTLLTPTPIAVTALESDMDTLFYVDTNVSAGVDINGVDGRIYYWYKVIAVDTNFGVAQDQTVYSTFSNANSGYLAPDSEVTTVSETLAAPAINFYGQGASNNLRIQWTAVEADTDTGALAATGYEVYYSTASTGEFTLIATTSTTAITSSVLGTSTWLTPVDPGYDLGVQISYASFENGVPYYFKVKSVNSVESMYSVPSNVVSNWLNGLDSASISGGFTETDDVGDIDGDLAVSMTAAITGADDYYLIVSTNSDLSVLGDRVYTVTVSEEALLAGDYVYAAIDLNGETTYYYGIRASSTTGAVGEDSYSNALSFTTGEVSP